MPRRLVIPPGESEASARRRLGTMLAERFGLVN